jgi:prevent-host-death family protein
MREQQPTTRTMKASDARQQFAGVLNRVFRKEMRVVVERSGIPVAAIVSTDDLERLDRLDAERAARFKVIEEMRAAFKDVSPEEIEREAARSLAEVRAAMRAEREHATAKR